MGYLIVGVMLINRYRHEINLFMDAANYFMAGLGLIVLMVIIDVIGNKEDILSKFISDPGLCEDLWKALEVFEEMIKIIAEGVLLAGTMFCHELAKRFNGKN